MAEWIAYAEVEPFGDRLDWLRTGVLASLWANMNRKKGTPAFKPEDFMPDSPEKRIVKKRKQTPAEMKALFMPLAEAGKARAAQEAKRAARG